VLVAWCPDWSVLCAMAEAQAPRHLPAAVVAGNKVLACNEAARAAKVRRGMRRRDAQTRCPDLLLLTDNPQREARDFEPVLAWLEELSPGIAALRPGLAALHSPARYYGGEREAAAVIAEKLVGLGIWDCRFGIADDLFTAEQAARRADQQDSTVVPAGGSAAFLAPLDVRVLDDPETTDLLRRLGIRTLGDLACLPYADVLTRFGTDGARLHRLARGGDTDRLPVRQPPPDLVCEVDFEPPLASVESVAFSVRRTAEQFVHQIGARNLVCTRALIEVESEGLVTSSRLWVHARWFRAGDLVDRVHWQLSRRGEKAVGPVTRVRFVPDALEPDVVHADGLWGNADASQVERGVARVQALLGFESVVQPVLQGGRSPSARQAHVPWGESPLGMRPRDLPWPGSIPPPAPARVLPEAWPAQVVDGRGHPTTVTARGLLTGTPARFRAHASPRGGTPWTQVAAWAGPWPVEETWWEPDARRLSRFQMVGVDGQAWLLTCSGEQWWTEASYD
jgi:protein ImuB